MKRILGMVLVTGMLVSSALAQTSTVTSVNSVGYNTIEIGPGDLALVTLPFETFGDSTLENLVGDQLPVGSVAYIWDRATTNYIPSTRSLFGGWSGTDIVLRGDAFWLKNVGATTSTVTFLGEVPAEYNNAATTTVYGITLDAVGYAYPANVQWTNTTLAKAAPVGSIMWYWNQEIQNYDPGYTKSLFGGWSTPAGFEIEAGKSFWLKSSAVIDWEEVMPYDLGE